MYLVPKITYDKVDIVSLSRSELGLSDIFSGTDLKEEIASLSRTIYRSFREH